MSWWRDAVIYQIYPRSFADGDGDGMGDFAGVRARLPYLADLGVDAIWFSPFYPSPMADGGYDVADYRDVDPRFGTLADFDAVVAEAAERDIRIIVDLVPNHCSSAHPVFQAALAAAPGGPERDLFMFRDGRGDGPPNNWQSIFGGSAWTQVPDGQWYLHLFDSSQPDWNWRNPAVHRLFEDVIRFWLDRGVAGLRVDVAHGLYKDPLLPDAADPTPSDRPSAWYHRPELHDLYRTWREILDSYPGEVFPGERTAVGEFWFDEREGMLAYFVDGEMHEVFNFLPIATPWDATAWRDTVDFSVSAAQGNSVVAPWVIGNHDVTRPVTRYGRREPAIWDRPTPAEVDEELGGRRARAVALLQLALPGSAYVYQGEELGLPEVLDLPDEVRDDPVFHRTKGERVGRDGCRIPLPWSGDAAPFGFSPDGASTWLPQPEDWKRRTVEVQLSDPASTLRLYREAIRLRPSGPMRWLDGEEPGVLAFARGDGFVCMVNMGDAPVTLPADREVLLASASVTDGLLPADGAVWLTG
nr:alpha-amylase family glycosyl hydrolase [Actinomadura sp. HBU206391]